VNKLVMGHAMLEQLTRKMGIAQLACLDFMDLGAPRNVILSAKVVNSMEVFSMSLGQMIVLNAQRRNLRS